MSIWPKQDIREIADGVVAILHGHGETGVSNSAFIVEKQSAFVVDTMLFPEMAEGVIHEIKRRGAHTDTVLNTHNHIDHIGGNKAFADARIIAHPESIRTIHRLGLPTGFYDRLMPQFCGRFDNLELTMPTPLDDQEVVPHDGELHIFTPAHTPADIAVWFPSSRVLLAGDLCFINVVPTAAHGLISGWIKALDALIALQPDVVVPGHGPVGTLTDLLVLRDYFIAIQRAGQRTVEENIPLQDTLAAFDAGPVSEWIEPERTKINLERAMQEARGDISPTSLSVMPFSIKTDS